MTLTAPIFDIQRFSLHDGPGIRSLVFLKGCALHCPWCQNPESQDHAPIVAFYRERCDEYFECEAACDEGAVRREGFRIDHTKCTVCGRCVDACMGRIDKRECLHRLETEWLPSDVLEEVE